MTDQESKEKKRRSLSLQNVGHAGAPRDSGGYVRQSLSHGRSKTVEVEVKRKRFHGTGQTSGSQKDDGSKLTAKEQDVRLRALQTAVKQAEQDRLDRIAREEERLRQIRQKEEQEAIRRQEEERRLQEEEKRYEEEAAIIRAPEFFPAFPEGKAESVSHGRPVRKEEKKDDGQTGWRSSRAPARTSEEAKPGKRMADNNSGKSSRTKRHGSSQYRDAEGSEESGRHGPVVGLKKLRRKSASERRKMARAAVRRVEIPDHLTVAGLAERLSEKVSTVLKALASNGIHLSEDEEIDGDMAELVVSDLGHEPVRIKQHNPEEILFKKRIGTEVRAPVVTVMGHVDHGKTSLLDALRKTDVASREAGGITQHIGAYQVTLASGKKITFIDTPGHEAFTKMRARGAGVTDIVVLVVAADDGVRPQTVEAIAHARAAHVPIIVAISKVDKPGANPDTVRQRLLSHEIVVEALGGDVQDVEISSVTGKNLDKLEEAILLQADMLELQADPRGPARGVVIETHVKKGHGAVATMLVQEGTLKSGDVVVVGEIFGRVRALFDDKGKGVKAVGPSVPCQMMGLGKLPEAGDAFAVVADETEAQEIIQWRIAERAHAVIEPVTQKSLEELLGQRVITELPIVLKADVAGSLEGISYELERIKHDEVSPRVLYKGVGAITEGDVMLAAASKGIVIGFGVRATQQAIQLAEQEGVSILYHNIIYHAVDDIKNRLSGLLTPIIEEDFLGKGEVIQIFTFKKNEQIAGCMIRKGLMRRGAKARVIRGSTVLHTGVIRSLRHKKDDMKEVKEGYECGVLFENYNDFQLKDIIECFVTREVKRSL